MAAVTFDGGPARSSVDRNFFLILVGLVWIGILSGFGTDSFNHVSKQGLDYPLIVHAHAVAFVGWLALFTTQVMLIRNGRPDIHRKLGVLGLVLACVMVVLGPATALVVDARRFETAGQTPEFLAVQFTDMIAFATFTAAGLLMRRDAGVHKRMMLMGLFYISNAGWARYLTWFVVGQPGQSYWQDLAGGYMGGDLLILALGVYDLVTRRRLYPAYLIGVAWVLALQLTAEWLLYYSAPWKAFTVKLIGH